MVAVELHVAGVIVVGPNDPGICRARAKTDHRVDALALANGSLDGLWMPTSAPA